jgi:myo-inositol-hexaphosphate 3-phosphohydrolase
VGIEVYWLQGTVVQQKKSKATSTQNVDLKYLWKLVGHEYSTTPNMW